jgi:endoglycosylceramidase
VQVTGDALLETEFGNTTDQATLDGQLSRYDGAMVPWMFWSYSRFICGYGSDGTTLAPAAGATVDWATLTTLARPYPQLVSGTPGSWQYDPSARGFTLSYTTARADGTGTFGPGAETAIAVPRLAYPAGYRATVTGGHVISAPGAPVLRIAAAAGATRVDVQVAPV